ncbi:MAG: hypothetical protein WCF95_06585 [bacterium]
MHFKEFMDILEGLKPDEIFYFKPRYPNLNAFHSEMKPHLFQISKGSEGYFRLKYMAVLEEISVTPAKLEHLFVERSWHDCIQFDMIKDYNEWMNKAQ